MALIKTTIKLLYDYILIIIVNYFVQVQISYILTFVMYILLYKQKNLMYSHVIRLYVICT